MLPIAPVILAMCVANMVNKSFSVATITTHLSAVSYIHRLFGFPEPVSSFLVQKALAGARNGAPMAVVHCTFTHKLSMLPRLVSSLTSTISVATQRIRYQSMFLLAFYACLRVGEITSSQGVYIVQYFGARSDSFFS